MSASSVRVSVALPDTISDDPSPPGWEARCLQEQVDPAGVTSLEVSKLE